MKKILSSFLLLIIVLAVNAQKKPAVSCPTVMVSCADMVAAGDTTYFTANVSGGDAKVDPTFSWTVSAGSIISGQGTSTIMVVTEGVSGTITATVDVGGYARECATSNSCTFTITHKVKKEVSSDTFTSAAIDLIVKEFILFSNWQNVYPQPTAFVYLYPAKKWKSTQTVKMQQEIIKALERNRIDKANYKIVTGRTKAKASYAIYSVPYGAAEPEEEN